MARSCLWAIIFLSYEFSEVITSQHDLQSSSDKIIEDFNLNSHHHLKSQHSNNAKYFYDRGRYYQYDLSDTVNSIQEYKKSAILLESESCNFDCSGMFNDLGVLYRAQGDIAEAEKAFQTSLKYSPTFGLALANLAEIYASRGLIQDANDLYHQAISSAENSAEIMYSYARFLSTSGNKTEALFIYRKAIEMKPFFAQAYEAAGLISCQLENFMESYDLYENALHLLLAKPNLSISERKMFFRIKFQQALGIIPKLVSSETVWKDIRQSYLHNIFSLIREFPLNALTGGQPIESLGCSAIGYYLIYQGGPKSDIFSSPQGLNDIIPRQLFSFLFYRAFYDDLRPTYLPLSTSALSIHPIDQNFKRIRVGFLSAFFCHHSVGLLLQGVIKNLSRERFSVTTFFLPPIKSDKVSESIYQASDEVVLLLNPSVSQNRAEIVSRNLDILIFGEIGMDLMTYLLAFSSIAPKTLVFWGHAMTSGIVDFSSVASIPSLSEELFNVSGSRLISSSSRFGPDYFISSALFENQNQLLSLQQQRYSERLILQEGLTTFFEEPQPPSVTLLSELEKLEYISSFLSPLQLVDISSTLGYIHQLIERNKLIVHKLHFYGVPQTIYKLSPQMVDSMRQVLLLDPHALFFVPEGSEFDLATRAIHHFQKSLPLELASRIIFLRQMKGSEYITMCSLFDVVMDTFPVGGGRSSFEIFSTGTPIVVYYPGTSILQLTYGMYRTMGIDESCCIRYSREEYIALTIEMASNHTLNKEIRSQILQYKYRLYSNQTVLQEWEDMLLYVYHAPRPVPFTSRSPSVHPHIHPDVLHDLEIIQQSSSWNSSELSEELVLAMSTPYLDPPVRVKDRIQTMNYDIISRV